MGKQISKSLGVRKKIGQAALALSVSLQGLSASCDTIHLSSSKTVLNFGKKLKELKGPVVEEESPAVA